MKRVLIISPNFPPVNAADMHRVRQSLPYFREFGWEPVVLAVDEQHAQAYSTDPLLQDTIPADIEVHKVRAWDHNHTRKFGLGSLGIRSYIYFLRKGDELLKKTRFDLVYFSTTAFHVMALGPRWKKKFGVPFVLDIQDPWRSDFYLDKPKSERPPKFFLSYNIDKRLEAATVPKAAGIISVSAGYCETFLDRYPGLQKEQCRVIPFGAAPYDFAIMEKNIHGVPGIQLSPDKINIVYVGRGGHDMRFALKIIFGALKKGLERNPALFARVHCWFVGTSYARSGSGQKTVEPIARGFGLGDQVTEITDRIPYFDTLFLLKKADMLLVPGSIDTSYTASKIYAYVLAGRPLLAIFHRKSSVVDMLQHIRYGRLVVFGDTTSADSYTEACLKTLEEILAGGLRETTVEEAAFERYTARSRTQEQVAFFEEVLDRTGRQSDRHNDINKE